MFIDKVYKYLQIKLRGKSKIVGFVCLFAFIGVATLLLTRAATVTSTVKSGNWSDPTVWSNGTVPGSTNVATVRSGHSVVYDMPQSQIAGMNVEAAATLIFADSKSTSLESSANVIIAGKLVMRPLNPSIIQTLRFIGIDESKVVGGGMDILASDVGLWVMGAGQLDIVGANKTAWTNLANSELKGATTITLKATPVGWAIGDELTISPTESSAALAARYTGFDEAKIVSITSNTIGLDRPLARDHPKVNNQWTAEVMNLTRNARIEGTAAGRAHIFIRSTKPQVVDYLDIRYMGPRPAHVSTARPMGAEPKWPSPMEILGRYGLHIHHSLEGSRGSTITGTVVRDTGNHAFVPHMSHGITFKDTISYNTIYDAYWWDGPRLPTGCYAFNYRTCQLSADSTHDTVFENCIAAKVTAIGNNVRLSAFELGLGDRNIVRGCVAVGVAAGSDSSGFDWPEGAIGVWGFTNNIAHNNIMSGIFGWQNTSADHVIENFTAYHNNNGIEHGAYTNMYLYKGGILYGNTNTGVQLHAVTSTGSTTKKLTFENMTIDSGGVGNSLVQTVGHNAQTFVPTLFRNINFKAHNILLQQNNSGGNPDVIDIVDSQLTGITVKNVNTPATSVIRVQSGNSAYAVLPPGHSAEGRATFMPDWNAYKLAIQPFYGAGIVSEDLTTPSIAVSTFDSNQIVSGAYTFRANILDNVAVTKVEFYIDDKLLITKTTGPNSFNYDTALLVDGQHQGMVKAYDAAGNIGTRTFRFRSANITAPPDTTGPTVTITNPKAGATVSGIAYKLSATASDTSGIKQVEFFIDGQSKNVDTISPYEYTFDSKTFSNANHTFGAIATDNSANANKNTVVNVTAKVDNFTYWAEDIDMDRSVGPLDFIKFKSKYGQTNYTGREDINGDRSVGPLDFIKFKAKYGTSY